MSQGCRDHYSITKTVTVTTKSADKAAEDSEPAAARRSSDVFYNPRGILSERTVNMLC